jgi:hypothetical protein
MCDDLLIFDNTAPTAADHEALIARIVGEPQSGSGTMPPLLV